MVQTLVRTHLRMLYSKASKMAAIAMVKKITQISGNFITHMHIH